MTTSNPLLDIKGLKTCFFNKLNMISPVDDVSLQIYPKETLAVVGESGCGKSTLALSVMKLIEKPGIICSGEILFNGKDLVELSEKEMRSVRGQHISMVFQDPMSAFHPLMTIGEQLTETIKTGTKNEKKKKIIEILTLVGLPDPIRQMRSYSFELSGGMLQRVMIAMALLNHPKLLIADEPTTALDVTVQANIVRLLRNLQERLGMSMLFISHDLGVVAQLADKVAVMYQGKIVESGKVAEIFTRPKHAYTRHLLEMAPVLGAPLPKTNKAANSSAIEESTHVLEGFVV